MCRAVNIRFQEYDIYIGRPGKGITDAPFGNPHPVDSLCPICKVVHGRGEAVAAFKPWFYSEEGKLMRQLVEDRIKPGMRLGCFCKPLRECHGDVIAAYVNNNYTKPPDVPQLHRDVWEE